MSTENIKEIVREKYGEAALRVGAGGSACCGSAPSSARRLCRSDHFQSLRRLAGRPDSRRSHARFSRMRQSHCARETQSWRNRSRPWLRRRHRRVALRPASGPCGQSLRPRHDRRNARARKRKQAQVGPRERRISERRDRTHPPSLKFRRRHHLQLRHQSFGRQGSRVRRSLPRAQARRPFRRLRCRHQGEMLRSKFARACLHGSAVSPGRWNRTTIAASSRPRDSSRWISSRRASIALKTPANFCPVRASTSDKPSPRRWTANS